MKLSDHHAAIIAGWAHSVPEVVSVVLFGSYAKGTARPESDVDVALEIFEGEGPLATFLTRGEEWQNELRALTGLLVNIELLHEVEAPRAYSFVREASVVLFRRPI